MSQRLRVVAAVPNYNMGTSLARLLPQLLSQGYDEVFVLDDASTDDSVDVVEGFGGQVTLVRSPVNQGAGANRNQILRVVDDNALIHFVDADMDLLTVDTAAVARDLAARYQGSGVGVIGGLVSRADGSQEPYNYGPVFSLRTHLTSVPPLLDKLRARPRLVAALGRLPVPARAHWPDVFAAPAPTDTYWLHEGNMLIFADVFRSIGGYDPRIRYHEAQEVAIRLDRRGVKRQFDPSIAVIHHYIDVRGASRGRQERNSALYLIRKHGLRRYLTDSPSRR